jgi:hypothetical protein
MAPGTSSTPSSPSSGSGAAAPVCGAAPCAASAPKKTVTARIVSLTFRSDHLDSSGNKLLKQQDPIPGPKLKVAWLNYAHSPWTTKIKHVTSRFDDTFSEFLKPEWDANRTSPDDDVQPISHTKNKNVTVDIEIEFKVKPKGQHAQLTRIKGFCERRRSMSFDKKLSRNVGTGRITVSKLVSTGKLPNFVTSFERSIDWSIVVDGKRKSIGTSGPHRVYVTFDKPGGKMGSPHDNDFDENVGKDQIVTEPRLKFSVEAADGTGETDEKECVDALFRHISYDLGIGYSLDRRFEHDRTKTGIKPFPTLHHYLWLCNAGKAQGECHNIAAAFALACKILGVKGKFEVGYMYPWSSRKDVSPSYPKRGDHILGRLNQPCERNHSGASHGSERVVFLDARDNANNFEGVARYRNALYAIGDAIFDLHASPDENASTYFGKRDDDFDSNGDQTGKIIHSDLTHGLFLLNWVRLDSNGEDIGTCDKPYPSTIKLPTPANSSQAHTFRWET